MLWSIMKITFRSINTLPSTQRHTNDFSHLSLFLLDTPRTSTWISGVPKWQNTLLNIYFCSVFFLLIECLLLNDVTSDACTLWRFCMKMLIPKSCFIVYEDTNSKARFKLFFPPFSLDLFTRSYRCRIIRGLDCCSVPWSILKDFK